MRSGSRQQASIAVRKLDVVFNAGSDAEVHALSDITLDIPGGTFVALVGPSGCGKSTLLKTVAALLAPTRGSVTIAGEPATALRRQGRIGVAFQQANLMPWLTTTDNIRLLGDLVAGREGALPVSSERVQALIQMVGLQGFEAKFPHQLSGGMQSRAAIARALALDPAVLLMDEPFAALDEITRDRMTFELMAIWERIRQTVLFVTHNLAEGIFLSDRVVLMSPRPGRIHRVFEIDLPRPRTHETRLTEHFGRLVAELNRELYSVMQ